MDIKTQIIIFESLTILIFLTNLAEQWLMTKRLAKVVAEAKEQKEEMARMKEFINGERNPAKEQQHESICPSAMQLPAMPYNVRKFVLIGIKSKKYYVVDGNIGNPLVAAWIVTMGEFNEYSASFSLQIVTTEDFENFRNFIDRKSHD